MENEKKVSIPSVMNAFLERKDRFSLIDEELKIGQVLPPARILESGSGDGGGALHLHEQGYEAYAADISREHISIETEKTIQFVQTDICSLPFADGFFDVIYSEAAFSVLPDKQRAAQEYKRVLKSGGLVIINDFCYAEEQNGTVPGLENYPGAVGARTPESYKRNFEKIGFECIVSKEVFKQFLRISTSLSSAFGVRGRELPAYLGRLTGSNGENNNFGGRFSYCMLMLRKKDD